GAAGRPGRRARLAGRARRRRPRRLRSLGRTDRRRGVRRRGRAAPARRRRRRPGGRVPAADVQSRRPGVARGCRRMSAAIRAEVRKLFSTRLWWLLALVLVAYLVFIGAVMAFSFTVQVDTMGQAEMPTGEDMAKQIYSLTSPIGYVFPLIIGSLLFTGEFRHKTITASLLVEPSRWILLGAKLLASLSVGVVYGILGTASTVVGAAPILAWRGEGAFLRAGDILVLLGTSAVVMTIWAVLGPP